MKAIVPLFLALSAFALSASNQLLAGNATWNLNPISGDWRTAANWTPQIVPKDVATFAVSSTTSISVAPRATIGSIVFAAGASSFSIRTAPSGNGDHLDLIISGAGITNNSGVVQNFVSGMDPAGDGIPIVFKGTATVGSSTTITTEANPTGDFFWGASVSFHDQSSAGDGAFYNKGGAVGISAGGQTIFNDNSTASNATFVIDGGSVSGAGGGVTSFTGLSDASNAVIIANGGSVSGASGGIISFQGNPSLNNATLICNGGLNGGGGGSIWFNGYTARDTNTARVELFGSPRAGNAAMFVEQTGNSGVDIGSLEGDGGIVFLGVSRLSVGRNDLDTTFGGLLAGDSGGYNEGGELTKFGQGTLTLSGANVYAGVTTVISGALVAANTTGSATGTGPVQVNGGTFGGNGSVDGAVTIGTGGGAGAFLEPSIGGNKPTTLTIQSALSFKSDSIYSYKLNSRQTRADSVVASGVTIESGAVFSMTVIGRGILNPGTVFTVISNTASTPIAGIFANLPDGSTFVQARNKFQASYEGGDGNDLTLTVVP